MKNFSRIIFHSFPERKTLICGSKELSLNCEKGEKLLLHANRKREREKAENF